MSEKLYQGHQSPVYESLEGFAKDRVAMDAPKLRGIESPARDHTWSVSEDGGLTFRNPTMDERAEFLRALGRLCRDCGDAGAEGDEPPIVLPCGHIAHVSCHLPEGFIYCAFGTTVDVIELANTLRNRAPL